MYKYNAAKAGVIYQNNRLFIDIPNKEEMKLIKNNIYELIIGMYHKNILVNPVKELWFSKSSLSAGKIKIITRLRTDHSFNNKYLHLIGKKDTSLCKICGIPEYNMHFNKECQ